MIPPIRLLISGGPGAGCTSTAKVISQLLEIPMFDSDAFFHKPSEPPFQEPHSPDERRTLLVSALAKETNWIISGSIATWELPSFRATHGVLLDVPQRARLERLITRQRHRFGNRIDAGGDMHDEHESFMEWAAAYAERTGSGRNLATHRTFLLSHCDNFMSFDQVTTLDVVVQDLVAFLQTFKC